MEMQDNDLIQMQLLQEAVAQTDTALSKARMAIAEALFDSDADRRVGHKALLAAELAANQAKLRLAAHGAKLREIERRAKIKASIGSAYRQNGAKGGQASAAKIAEVREFALRLARERQPEKGWKSAPEAADAVLSDVEAFARRKGRRFSRRKVEEWLRASGVKRPKLPSSR